MNSNPHPTAFLLSVAIVFLMACGGTSDLLTSSFIPVSRAYVKVKADQHDQYRITVYLTHLMKNPQIQSARQSYVVWMVSESGVIQNIGALRASSFLSPSAFKSTFRPGMDDKPVRIYITVEDDPGIAHSNTAIVFSTSRFQD